jgi:hypothetical protein
MFVTMPRISVFEMKFLIKKWVETLYVVRTTFKIILWLFK